MLSYSQRSANRLLNVTTPTSTAQVGTTWRLVSTDPDAQFRFSVTLAATGGASTPTAQAKLQTSADGVNWIDVATTSAYAADGVVHVDLLDPSGGGLTTFIRATTVLAGGTLPTHTVQAEIVGTAPFQLLAQ